jgi:hypothetical protein
LELLGVERKIPELRAQDPEVTLGISPSRQGTICEALPRIKGEGEIPVGPHHSNTQPTLKATFSNLLLIMVSPLEKSSPAALLTALLLRDPYSALLAEASTPSSLLSPMSL